VGGSGPGEAGRFTSPKINKRKQSKKEAVKKLEKYVNLDEFSHNLVTKPKIEEAEESKLINITS